MGSTAGVAQALRFDGTVTTAAAATAGGGDNTTETTRVLDDLLHVLKRARGRDAFFHVCRPFT
jgi:hypothetical protein